MKGQTEALKAITENLGVQAMGPADHIRTKHEVKAFLEAAGDAKEAEAIVLRARGRRELWQTKSIAQNLTQRQQRAQGRTGKPTTRASGRRAISIQVRRLGNAPF